MDLVESGRNIIELEIQALRQVAEGLGDEFARAVTLIADCQGRVIVTGVGKAGIIGQKVSATLASTGTASHWIHAVEARHGDLGRVVEKDLVLVLSNSGETEVVQLLVPLKKVLDIGQIQEACPLGLAPSCTTTAMLAVGDAIALTLFKMRSLTKEDYAFDHPGGELGRKLITVQEAMRIGERNPVAMQDVSVREAIEAMNTKGSPGAVSLVDGEGKLVGVFTDGDLRRRMIETGPSLLDGPVADVMTRSPKTVRADDLAAEAYRIMRQYRIDNLPVVDDHGMPVGLIDVQDWLDVERGLDAPQAGGESGA